MTIAEPKLIRFAHPMAFTKFLDHVGAPSKGYLRRQGLPTLCDDANAFVPLIRAWRLFEDATRREGPELPWQVGEFVRENGLHAGLIGEIGGAPSLYQALQVLIRRVNSEASHLRLGIIERKKEIFFFTSGYFNLINEPGFSASQAYQLAVYVAIIRHFTGSKWQPGKLGIAGASVPKLVYGRFANSRILLNQPFSYIAISRDVLHLSATGKFATGDDSYSQVMTDRLDFAESLTHLIIPYLPQGYPSLRFAASLVDISPRTLSRKLAGSGTSYQALVDELRFEKARKLLLDQDMHMSAISEALGFSQQANFSRLFRRIGGMSPLQYRRTIQAGRQSR